MKTSYFSIPIHFKSLDMFFLSSWCFPHRKYLNMWCLPFATKYKFNRSPVRIAWWIWSELSGLHILPWTYIKHMNLALYAICCRLFDTEVLFSFYQFWVASILLKIHLKSQNWIMQETIISSSLISIQKAMYINRKLNVTIRSSPPQITSLLCLKLLEHLSPHFESIDIKFVNTTTTEWRKIYSHCSQTIIFTCTFIYVSSHFWNLQKLYKYWTRHDILWITKQVYLVYQTCFWQSIVQPMGEEAI